MSIAYDPWRDIEKMGLRVVECDLPGTQLGRYLHVTETIEIQRGLTYIQARSTLTHELQHAYAGDIPSPVKSIHLLQELRARKRTSLTLIDPEEYAVAEEIHGVNLAAIAFDLDVTTLVVADWTVMNRR